MKRPQRNEYNADWTFAEALGNYTTELETVLRAAQSMRPVLLKQYSAVPECVLDYCNRARAALAQ